MTTTPTPEPAAAEAPAVPPEIAKIIENLHTQDNRITDNPLFAVQQKRIVAGLGDDYTDQHAWVYDGSEVDSEEAARLDALHAAGEPIPDDFRRVGYVEKWEFVTGCLTEQGCKDYIAANGHNLKEPRIYAYGSYRNAEFIALRRWLMSLRAAQPKAEAPAPDDFIESVKRLCVAARTTGGTAGRDEGLCRALDHVESMLKAKAIAHAFNDMAERLESIAPKADSTEPDPTLDTDWWRAGKADSTEPDHSKETNGLDRQASEADAGIRNLPLARYYIGAVCRGFVTAESGAGQYSIRIKYDSLAAMQAGHDALIYLPSSLKADSTEPTNKWWMTEQGRINEITRATYAGQAHGIELGKAMERDAQKADTAAAAEGVTDEPVGAVVTRMNLKDGSTTTKPELFPAYKSLPTGTRLYLRPASGDAKGGKA